MEKYKNPGLSPQERAEDLVSRMTAEEMASQLRYDAPPVERLGVPAYNWWNEALHGVARAGTATMFPQAIGLGATFDCELLYRSAQAIGREARAKYNAAKAHGDRDIYKGLTMWSPNINIFRDPRWGRGQETYGEDPYLTARMGVSFVKGLQGEGDTLTAAACAKHFAVHSGPEATRHRFNAEVSPKDLGETYLPAFEALVREARVEGVMGAYNRVNGEPACANGVLMEKLRSWGFGGYFVSDCWAICDFHTGHMVTATAPESAAMALKAGCDCNCGSTYLNLLVALREGLITEDDLRKAAVHLMRTRIRLGLFDEKTELDDIGYETVACESHKALSLQCARESMVLLKNNGLLPLDRSAVKSIAVIGPAAASMEVLRGNYYGTADTYVPFADGIRAAFPGRVFYAEGCHLFKDRLQSLSLPGDGIAEAVTAAEHADAVVLCVGLDATLEGEEGDTGNAFASGDRLDLRLPESQRRLMDAVLAVGKPTVVVLSSGSAVNPECAGADALLQAWYPGQLGGTALGEILFGDVSPSGKLPVTFYESAEKLPPFEDYSMAGRTYRYAADNVLYPFGYGLTYSRVTCSGLRYDAASGTASFTVRNGGETATGEVLQLYIKDNESRWAVPNHRLCGIARVFLQTGEEREMTIPVPKEAFGAVNDDGERVLDSHRFTIYAGVSQPDELSRQLTGIPCAQTEIQL